MMYVLMARRCKRVYCDLVSCRVSVRCRCQRDTIQNILVFSLGLSHFHVYARVRMLVCAWYNNYACDICVFLWRKIIYELIKQNCSKFAQNCHGQIRNYSLRMFCWCFVDRCSQCHGFNGFSRTTCTMPHHYCT